MPKSSISLRCIWMRESHFRHFSSSWADPKKLWRLWNPCMIRIRWLRTLTLPSRWVKCSVLPVRDILFCWTMVVVSSVEPGVETCSSTESPAWFLVAPVPWLFYQYFPGLTWLLLDTLHHPDQQLRHMSYMVWLLSIAAAGVAKVLYSLSSSTLAIAKSYAEFLRNMRIWNRNYCRAA